MMNSEELWSDKTKSTQLMGDLFDLTIWSTMPVPIWKYFARKWTFWV